MPNLSQPPAIVFSSMVTGLGVIRSLGQAGVPVIALDPNPLAPGLHSRYATQSLVCPDPLKSEHAFVDFLVGLGRDLRQKAVLFPTTDTYVPILARARTKLETLFHLPPYDETNVGPLTDKRLQMQVVEQAGVPVPQTYYPTSVAEVQALSAKLPYPTLLKPARSRPFFIQYGIKVSLAHTSQQLVCQYEGYLRAGHAMIIQEFIPGGDQNLYSTQTCTDLQAQPIADFVGKKILLEPPIFGPLVVSQQVDQPEVAALGHRAIQALGFRQYICNPQFKYDPRDCQWKFLELNPRPPISISVTTASGVNVPFVAYQQFLDRSVSRSAIQRPGASWVMELTTPNGYRNLGALFLAHRRHYLHQPTYAFFSAEDPKPFFYALMVGVQEVKNKLALGRMSG